MQERAEREAGCVQRGYLSGAAVNSHTRNDTDPFRYPLPVSRLMDSTYKFVTCSPCDTFPHDTSEEAMLGAGSR